MTKSSSQYWLFVLVGILAIPASARADAESGEKLLTPNQVKNITQINHDLPDDLIDKSGDSRQTSELRIHLRHALITYKETVKQFGNGTSQSRKAGHDVVDIQIALHKQYVREEAIPAVGLAELPNNRDK